MHEIDLKPSRSVVASCTILPKKLCCITHIYREITYVSSSVCVIIRVLHSQQQRSCNVMNDAIYISTYMVCLMTLQSKRELRHSTIICDHSYILDVIQYFQVPSTYTRFDV